MAGLRLLKNDSEDIGFVDACLIAGVITFEEFKCWLFWVVEIEVDAPNYVWDLMDLKEKFDYKPLQIMGFNPVWTHSRDEDDALDGIGYTRYADFISDATSRNLALEKLADNPHIIERFRKTFPFIEI